MWSSRKIKEFKKLLICSGARTKRTIARVAGKSHRGPPTTERSNSWSGGGRHWSRSTTKITTRKQRGEINKTRWQKQRRENKCPPSGGEEKTWSPIVSCDDWHQTVVCAPKQTRKHKHSKIFLKKYETSEDLINKPHRGEGNMQPRPFPPFHSHNQNPEFRFPGECL
uniref:Uncharacterized protein TCIL3000_7_5190 n=1 Tax=Trypanosoma congolense (strain IL3000) TaxID=1068625 RepID=G0UQP4_TRYCI|nr:unnamed protein product [Trypanosoma congolense IL3000]